MYKKHKIVLIKSNEDANIGQNNWYLPNSQQLVIDNKLSHLYILSDDNLIEGDWCYNISSQTMFKADKELIELINDPDVTLTTNKKIIATTDKSLLTEIDCPDCIEGCEVFHAICLPSIPEYFIKYYIEQYNLGNVIQEVHVLCDEFNNVEIFSGSTDEIIININISNKNYFQFEAALQVEKVYSRTEVIKLLHSLAHDVSINQWNSFEKVDIWIGQNLK